PVRPSSIGGLCAGINRNPYYTLALIGLGSVGLDLDRLDAFSDLDFFVIVEAGHREDLLNDLSWLQFGDPPAFVFRNTSDGYKCLSVDGQFAEFAVFEQPQLASIPFSPGRVVWKRAAVSDQLAIPELKSIAASINLDWQTDEALSNLYVGLQRFRRGERLSAMRFVQVYALDHVLAIMNSVDVAAGGHQDPFSPERRVEFRYPQWSALLERATGGTTATPASALAQLEFLEQHVAVNASMAAAIRALCVPQVPSEPSTRPD
ncbi:hypothetical protein, partial [Deinococcus ruber]|uniref:hypothetical protein n=1 Tax=Deinococcus ruber TaxID=1848197 RepID=UPI001665E703